MMLEEMLRLTINTHSKNHHGILNGFRSQQKAQNWRWGEILELWFTWEGQKAYFI